MDTGDSGDALFLLEGGDFLFSDFFGPYEVDAVKQFVQVNISFNMGKVFHQ